MQPYSYGGYPVRTDAPYRPQPRPPMPPPVIPNPPRPLPPHNLPFYRTTLRMPTTHRPRPPPSRTRRPPKGHRRPIRFVTRHCKCMYCGAYDDMLSLLLLSLLTNLQRPRTHRPPHCVLVPPSPKPKPKNLKKSKNKTNQQS